MIFHVVDKSIQILGIENPDSKAIYEEANKTVEKWSQAFYIAFVKVTCPLLMIPYFILCFFLYFTTDQGRDAFIRPFPYW